MQFVSETFLNLHFMPLRSCNEVLIVEKSVPYVITKEITLYLSGPLLSEWVVSLLNCAV